MSKHLDACVAVCIALLLGSCASQKMKMRVPPDPEITIDAGERRLFLVGDAGEDTGIFRANMRLLRERLRSSAIPATVIFLGDNAYPRGVPEKEDSALYQEAVHILQAQVDAVADLADDVIFIPGNHDWNKGRAGGLRAIRQQGALIDSTGKARLLPALGCPGPEVVELTPDVALFILDSQWWLQDWRTESEMHEGCEIRTRADLIVAFSELLKDYQGQRVIVAMHHPLYSSGAHSGYFTAREHIFPLTTLHSLRNFYLPLPILGSIHPLYRGNFGNVQD